MRVVLDTNVLLSGLMLPASTPGRIVRAIREGTLRLAMSQALIDELSRAMGYPKVRRRIQLTAEELERFTSELRFFVDMVDASGIEAKVPRDRGDDIVLAAFLASGAEVLVSGDEALLALRERYPIVSPAEFAERHLP